jgi:hypothetical protein
VCFSPQTAERRFAILLIGDDTTNYREFSMKTTLTFACLTLCMLSGCATPITSYTPAADQLAEYDQGVGSVRWETDEAVLTMYPTFQFQSPSDIPTFTLMVQNKTNHNIDFVPTSINAWLDERQCHVYTLEERISEIKSAAKRKQIALAVLGGVVAAGAGYAASHQTTTYSSYGTIGNRQFFSSGMIQTYDPASGIFAGAVVGAATGVGIHQIAREAGYEIQAAQAIFQHTTIRPGTTIVGQVMLKPSSNHFGNLRLDVPVSTAQTTFTFTKKTS